MPTPLALATRPLDLPQVDFENWLQHTGKSIGGSSIGAVCGLSSYGTPTSVWDGLVSPNVRHEDNPNMARGRIMEPHIAQMYSAATGRTLVELPSIRHPQMWMFRATPDRGIISRSDVGGVENPGILECKSLGRETFSQTRTEGIDPAYYAQLQWYLGLFGYQWGAFALHNLDAWTLHHFDVEYDHPYFEYLWNTAQAFWNNFVLTRTRPDDNDRQILFAAPQTPRAGAEAIVRLDRVWVDAMNALRETTENMNLLKIALENAQTRVKEMMGEDELCVIPGVGRISYAESYRTSFDKDALYRDYPQLENVYERRTATRVFRPTFENGPTTRRRR